VSEKTQKGC